MELWTRTRVLAGVLVLQCMAGQASSVVSTTTSASLELKPTQLVVFATVKRSLKVASGGTLLGGSGGQNSANALEVSLSEETLLSAAHTMGNDTLPLTLLHLLADV